MTMIRFKCPACQKILKILDEGAGRKVNCPKCGQMMQVPTPTSLAQGAAPLPPSAPASSPVAPEVRAGDGEPEGQRPTGLVTRRAGFLAVSIVLCGVMALCCVVATVQDKPPLAQESISYQPEKRHKTETHFEKEAADTVEATDAVRQEALKNFPNASQYLISLTSLKNADWMSNKNVAWVVEIESISSLGISFKKENGVGVARENIGFHSRLNPYSTMFNVNENVREGDGFLLEGRLLRVVNGIGIIKSLFFIVADWSLTRIYGDDPQILERTPKQEPRFTIPISRGEAKKIIAGRFAPPTGEDGFKLLLRHHGYREQYARILEEMAQQNDDKKIKACNDKIQELIKVIDKERQDWKNRFFLFHGTVVKASDRKVLDRNGVLESEEYTRLVVAVQVREGRKADLTACTIRARSTDFRVGQKLTLRGKAIKIANVDKLDPPYSWSNFQQAPLVISFYRNSAVVVADANPPH